MADTVWPMSSTDCHTRGTKTTTNLRLANHGGKVSLCLVIGDAMGITIHCDSLEEVIAIRDRLNDCITIAKGDKL